MVDHRDDDQKQGEPAYSTEDDPPPISLSPSRFGIVQATRSSSVDHEVAVSHPPPNYASSKTIDCPPLRLVGSMRSDPQI